MNKSLKDVIFDSEGRYQQYEKSDLALLDPILQEKQYSLEEIMAEYLSSEDFANVLKIENEIIEEGVNRGLRVHGARHIIDVVLYASIIGLKNLSEEDLKLVLISAKYHDSARKSDRFEEHAVPSAINAIKILQGKLFEEEIAIIATCIEFHEIPRNLVNIDEIFLNISSKYGIKNEDYMRVRKIAEILKDADALDRTRFVNSARLNPKYLKFDEAKRLVKFAASIQEEYAISDLKELVPDDYISLLIEYFTPQEALRHYRKNGFGQNPSEYFNKIIRWNKKDNML